MGEDELPYAKTVAVVGLALLALSIGWFAVTAEDHPAPTPPPVVTERQVPLEDGGTVRCLVFSSSTSCDWRAAQ